MEKSLTLIIPLFKSESNISSLIERLIEIENNFSISITIRFVIDGRKNDLISLISNSNLNKLNSNFDILILSKNFGVGPALLAGMQKIETDFVCAIGADLQEPDWILGEMYKRMNERKIEICLGVRKSRNDNFIHKVGAKFYWNLNKFILDKEIPKGGFDIFMITKKVSSILSKFDEKNTNFTSLLFWMGFEREFVYFDREKRKAGKSSWTLRKKAKLFFDSIFNFSNLPVKIISFGAVLNTILLFLLSFNSFNPNSSFKFNVENSTILVLITFGNSLSYFFMSILGNYTHRINQNNINRPNFIISDYINKENIVYNSNTIDDK